MSICEVFPAEASGGIKYLKSISALITSRVQYFPLGGLNTENNQYLYLEMLSPSVVLGLLIHRRSKRLDRSD